MKRRYSILLLILFILCLFIFAIPSIFSALKRWDTKINTPPSVDAVQEQFVNNLDDINAVVSFMQSSGYDGFFIQDSTELASSGSRTIQIQDNEIRFAIKRLFHNRNYLDISKIGNTVTLLQWRGVYDVGCGIIYTNNVEESINTEFVTELIPISEDGWYYYVSDYNAWRNGQRGSADQQSSDQPNGPVPDFSGTGSTANENDTSGDRTSYQNAKISYQGKQYIYRCPNFIYDAENVEEIGALTYSSEIKKRRFVHRFHGPERLRCETSFRWPDRRRAACKHRGDFGFPLFPGGCQLFHAVRV